MKQVLTALGLGLAAISIAHAQPRSLDRPPQDEVVYFLLADRFDNADPSNDRGGLKGDRLKTGYDPTSKGFYHGGDLKGVERRLDYLQGLGVTAIWLAPVYRNKPVQGGPGDESAGYHGYWITDFTRVDPHLGTNDDLKALVEAAHARGVKVYLDIVVNHTADVIAYRECPAMACPYRPKADYPYQRRGGPAGEPINAGFAGEGVQTADNFARLTRPDFAYTPFVPRGEEHAKVPDWLNDPIWYHNRGNSTFEGESSQLGDFIGLDDLMTENPRVVQGFIDIYGDWIERYRIDGYRIDTARHVNPELWQAFVPAMKARAARAGLPNFHIFGEVATGEPDVAQLARHTRVDKLPAVLDFGFFSAVRDTVAGGKGTAELARMFEDDALYEGGARAALDLPTFVSNHDAGRFAFYARKAFPNASPEELLKRTALAHAMLLTLRGEPVLYAGDEQGFEGLAGDQDSREDLFATQVVQYRQEERVGPRTAPFSTDHPLWREIAALSRLRQATPALRRGLQLTRFASDRPGLFAVSRFDPDTHREVLILFNTSTDQVNARVEVDAASRHFTALAGDCAAEPLAPASYPVTLAPLGYAVCAAGDPH